jgi:protoheme IX farnesyltransferase
MSKAVPSPGSQYWALTKPRVVALIVFTAIIGMLLACPDDCRRCARAVRFIGIWLAAASAAAINHLIDQRIDG